MFFPGCFCCGPGPYYLRRYDFTGADYVTVLDQYGPIPTGKTSANRLVYAGGKLYVQVTGSGSPTPLDLFRYDGSVSSEEYGPYVFTMGFTDCDADGTYVVRGGNFTLPLTGSRINVRNALTDANVYDAINTLTYSLVAHARLIPGGSGASLITWIDAGVQTYVTRFLNTGVMTWSMSLGMVGLHTCEIASTGNIWVGARTLGPRGVIYLVTSGGGYGGATPAFGYLTEGFPRQCAADGSGGMWCLTDTGYLLHFNSSLSRIATVGPDPTFTALTCITGTDEAIIFSGNVIKSYSSTGSLNWTTSSAKWGAPTGPRCATTDGTYLFAGGVPTT